VLLVTKRSFDLPVLLLPDGRLRVLEDLAFDTQRGRLVVPAGFVTDLASVPPFMRGLVPNAGRRVNLAAILHDWCCEHLKARLAQGLTLDDTRPDGPLYGPVATDVLFRETLRDLGMPPFMAWTMWDGVRWGAAGSAYRRPGWIGTAPLVVLVTLATGWLTVPAGLTALIFLCLYIVTEGMVHSVAALIDSVRGQRDGAGARAVTRTGGVDLAAADSPHR
jgi:hypothetical protein